MAIWSEDKHARFHGKFASMGITRKALEEKFKLKSGPMISGVAAVRHSELGHIGSVSQAMRGGGFHAIVPGRSGTLTKKPFETRGEAMAALAEHHGILPGSLGHGAEPKKVGADEMKARRAATAAKNAQGGSAARVTGRVMPDASKGGRLGGAGSIGAKSNAAKSAVRERGAAMGAQAETKRLLDNANDASAAKKWGDYRDHVAALRDHAIANPGAIDEKKVKPEAGGNGLLYHIGGKTDHADKALESIKKGGPTADMRDRAGKELTRQRRARAADARAAKKYGNATQFND